MPEPPFQNDPRSQSPPRPVTYPATPYLDGSYSSPTVLLTVTRPEQLPAALRQHEKPVVIENTTANAILTRDFDRLLRWQRRRDTYRLLVVVALLITWFLHTVITSRYKLNADWHVKWKVIEMSGRITLTPPEK